MELKLTNVARASLEELRLDYGDYLQQRDLPQWPPDEPPSAATSFVDVAKLMFEYLRVNWFGTGIEQTEN
jgi:hypothetical protein